MSRSLLHQTEQTLFERGLIYMSYNIVMRVHDLALESSYIGCSSRIDRSEFFRFGNFIFFFFYYFFFL